MTSQTNVDGASIQSIVPRPDCEVELQFLLIRLKGELTASKYYAMRNPDIGNYRGQVQGFEQAIYVLKEVFPFLKEDQ